MSSTSNPHASGKRNTAASTSGSFFKIIDNVQRSVAKAADDSRRAQEAKEAGQIWDSTTKEWKFYFLDQEWEELEQIAAEENASEGVSPSNSGPVGDQRKVADREYYDLLGIPTDADASTIKKAYYKEARKCHPDKNPDDEQAHEKFQALGTAYQVLSNEDSRAKYDKEGKPSETENTDMAQNMDPFVFFNVMFGSTLVEPYIGELWLANTADTLMKDQGEEIDPSLPEEEQIQLQREKIELMRSKDELKQKMRRVKCAKFLRERVAGFVSGKETEAAFIESCREEADKICNGAYGELYCATMGFAMEVAGDEYVGFQKSFLGLGGHAARTRKNVNAFNSNIKLIGAGLKAVGAGARAAAEAENMQKQLEAEGEGTEFDAAKAAGMAEAVDDSLPAFLELAWAINKRDIKATLRHVCKKLFDDASVPKDLRLKRAEAVRLLGKVFRTTGKQVKRQKPKKEGFGAEDIKARVAVAAQTTMAKAQGQEVHEDDHEEMIKMAKQMNQQEAQIAGEQPGQGRKQSFGAER